MNSASTALPAAATTTTAPGVNFLLFPNSHANLGVGDYRLVVHDWGSVGLIPAQREPERLRVLLHVRLDDQAFGRDCYVGF